MARVEFAHVLKIDPKNNVAQEYMGKIKALDERKAKERDHATRQREKVNTQFQKAQTIRTHFENGQSFIREKFFDQAINEFQKVLELDPNNAMAKEYIRFSEESAGWQQKEFFNDDRNGEKRSGSSA